MQVVVDGTESLSETQRKLKGLMKNFKLCNGVIITDNGVPETLSCIIEFKHFRGETDGKVAYYLL